MWSRDDNGHVSPAKCLVAWQTVCNTKEFSGLGIKDIGTQNICLLLKLLHKLYSNEPSAWAQWVRSRACLASLKGDLHGEHWQVLRSILPLYQTISTVQIGHGRDTSFWNDVWIGDDALADSFPMLFSHSNQKDVSVRDVMDNGLARTLVP